MFEKFVLETAAIIYIETDAEWKISRANQFVLKLYGKPLVGTNFRDFILDFTGMVDPDAFLQETDRKHLLNITTSSGLPQTFYFTFRKTDDKILIFGESNSLEIDELKKSLITLNNDLNNLTRELQKKNVLLNKLNEQKNEFIGMAAHDLRNPISIIIGYCEFILDEAEDKLPELHLRFLKIILNSSEFMLKMLNELLDIAKIESGKLNLNREMIDPAKLIQGNVSLNRIIAEKKDIDINIEIFEGLPEINADPDKIEQVLNNLISNAIKFSGKATKITVSAFRSNGEITVMVKDEGQGISDEDKEKLFKPFSKFKTKSTGGERSTGLGLTITKKIIMGHGGKIWLESEVGKGTSFYFSLPVS
jgi:signal transduction histidine kinase